MGECYPQRGAMETTVQEGRDSLPLESTPGYGPPTGLRLPPCWCGLYTMVVRLSRQLPRPARTLRPIVWRDKSTVPLSAMLTGVRRAFWGPGCCHTPAASQECSTLSPSLTETLLYALAPAAEMAGAAMRRTTVLWHSYAWQKGQSRAERLSEKSMLR